jgi:hypothetical protein
MRLLPTLCLLLPLIAAAQDNCKSLPDDAALQCLHKRQVLLEKTRSARSVQLKACLRDRLEEAPVELIKEELKEYDAGERLWRKQVEYNCRIHELAFYGGSARADQGLRCEIRETELRSARLLELGGYFACFDAKGQAKSTQNGSSK